MKTLARQRDQAELLRRLQGIGPETGRRWGRMSVHQMVCHLSDALRMATGERSTAPTGRLFHHTILKWVVLYVPLRWPAGIPTCPEIDQERDGTRPVDFVTDLAQLRTLLEQVPIRDRAGAWPVHPLFGPMSGAAWLRWAYLHTDHHLRQFGA